MSTRPHKPTGKLNDGIIPVRERLTLGEEWQAFQTAVIPAEASLTQRVEMKRAFYAGARTFLRLCMGDLDTDHEPTELDLQYMDSLHAEMVAFAGLIGSEDEVRAAQADAARR